MTGYAVTWWQAGFAVVLYGAALLVVVGLLGGLLNRLGRRR